MDREAKNRSGCFTVPSAGTFLCAAGNAWAQAEAKAISVRTKAALAAAKARGVALGGNRGKLTDKIRATARRRSSEVRRQAAQQRNADLFPIIQSIRANGASSLRQIAAELNRLGHTAPRGGQWQAAQVVRLCRF
jgi:DNA invertase Pin-like site-specific DNA recombinase